MLATRFSATAATAQRTAAGTLLVRDIRPVPGSAPRAPRLVGEAMALLPAGDREQGRAGARSPMSAF